MRGKIARIASSGTSLKKILGDEDCLQGIRFERFNKGIELEDRRIKNDGLTMLLEGKDPPNGKILKKLRRCKEMPLTYAYEIPINDCKELAVLGTCFSDVQDAHRLAQRRGAEAVKSYLSTHLMIRRQDKGMRRFMLAEQMLFVSTEHRLNNLGEPHMHTHLELINMCLADGKWVSVDSRQLYHMYENIRSVYETTVYGDPELRATLAAHGASISLRGGIPQLVEGSADVFSKRRDEINRRLDELVDQWKTNHAGGMAEVRDLDGHVVGYTGYRDTKELNRMTMVKLRQQAWADTRQPEKENRAHVDYDKMWLAELAAAGYNSDALLNDVPIKTTPMVGDVTEATMKQCAMNAVNALSNEHNKWSRNGLEVAVYDQIRDLDVTGTRGEIEMLATRIMNHALSLCASPEKDPLPFIRNLTALHNIKE